MSMSEMFAPGKGKKECVGETFVTKKIKLVCG